MPKKQAKSGRKRAPRSVKVVVNASARKSVPRPPSSSNAFATWLRAAKLNPWAVKPPGLGIRGEATLVYRMVYRVALDSTSFPQVQFAVKPYASSMFSYRADSITGNAIVVAASSLSTIAYLFGSARPICGGVKIRTIGPATSALGVVQLYQQPSNKSTSCWYAAAATPTFASSNTANMSWPNAPVPAAPTRSVVQLWSHEDFEDVQMDSDLITSNSTNSVNNHPTLVGTITGSGAGVTHWLDAVFWMEGAINDTIASLFGDNASNNVVDPNVLLQVQSRPYPTTYATDDTKSSYGGGSASSSSCNTLCQATRAFGEVARSAHGVVDAARVLSSPFQHP